MDFDSQTDIIRQIEMLHAQVAAAKQAALIRRRDKAFQTVRRAHIKAVKAHIKRLIRDLDRLERAA